MTTCITAARLFTPTAAIADPVVLVEEGTIQRLGSRAEIEIPSGCKHLDFPDLVIAPGFIDIHIHGGLGYDVMQDDPSGRVDFEKFLARHGVTAYLPTTVTASMERILGSLDRLGNAISAEFAEHEHVGARPLGIHLEGPFISAAKCGVHPVEYLLNPSMEVFRKFWDASGGTLKMMTVAPELPGADELIAGAREVGVLTSMGHSNATYDETTRGIQSGAVSSTHTFNAMRALDHREPGILGAVLASDMMMADIIADGVHVAPPIVDLFLRAKGEQRAVLITDAISATGMPDGKYWLGPFEVEVKGDRCEYQGKLAGSVLTLDRAVRNVTHFAVWELQRAVRLATANPAALIGESAKGTLAEDQDADLVLLTNDGRVVHTFVAGRMN